MPSLRANADASRLKNGMAVGENAPNESVTSGMNLNPALLDKSPYLSNFPFS